MKSKLPCGRCRVLSTVITYTFNVTPIVLATALGIIYGATGSTWALRGIGVITGSYVGICSAWAHGRFTKMREEKRILKEVLADYEKGKAQAMKILNKKE